MIDDIRIGENGDGNSAWMVLATHSDPRGDCLEWTGRLNDSGYGQLMFRRSPWLVHRFAWALVNGPIPDGMNVLHSCDNPPCFLLSHLFLGTHLDNARDKYAKGRGRHPKGSENGRAKLVEEDVKRIRRLRSSGCRLKVIAEEYGVSKGLISHICTGRIWN